MRTDIAEKFPVPDPSWSTTDWRIPFALAIAVHILALLLVILAPYFHGRPPIIDVQTVSLFSASELQQQTPAPKKIAKPAAPAPKTPAKKVSVAPPVKPAASKPAISLRPLKSKTKSAGEDLKVKQTMLERKLRQVQAAVEKERAENKVRKEVGTALERIRQSYASSGQPSSPPTDLSRSPEQTAASKGGAGNGSVEVSEAKKRYYAAIQMHLSRFWTLPESHDWNESLEVVAILWFRPDGRIVKRVFERKSENEFFNRFVQSTLEKVDMVPPVPLDLPSNEAEQIIQDGIGFRFHPSGIY